jgi:ribosomal protein S18 acetylase RimI-like enzyme
MTTIRICSESDLEKLQAFSEYNFKSTFEYDNDLHALNAYIAKALNFNQLKYELGLAGSQFYFLEEGEALLGGLKLNLPPHQSGINAPKSLEVERIYVDHNFHGQGYGKRLFDFAWDKVREYRSENTYLGVWERNFKAIDFYYKKGFVKFDQQHFKLGTEDQVDYLVRLNLPQN